MNFTVLSGDSVALLEVTADEFRAPAQSSTGVAMGPSIGFSIDAHSTSVDLALAPKAMERASQTERLNRSLVLGYLPAMRATFSR